MSKSKLIISFALIALGLLAGCGSDDSIDNPVVPREPTVHQVTVSEYLQANPVMSPDGNWILFESDAAGSMDIYRVPVAGGDPERLTDDPAFDSSATWTADGAEIVFESDRDGPKHLYLLTLDNPLAEPFALTGGPYQDGSPMASRNGATIVFESNREKADGSDLWTIPAGGGDLTRVTVTAEGVYNRTADWSPDGTKLVYESNRSGQSALYVQPLAGGAAVRITPESGYEGHPAWSPDGKMIAYESTITGRSELYAVAATGGDTLRLTVQGGYWPRFTPDASGIIYSVVGDASAGIWLMEVDF